jgi:hypothetical protein
MMSRTGVVRSSRPALERHAAHVVALGDDSRELPAFGHDERADVPFDHGLDGIQHGGRAVDPEDIAALRVEDVGDVCHRAWLQVQRSSTRSATAATPFAVRGCAQ